MSNVPRGPRIMHGMSKLAAQALNLSRLGQPEPNGPILGADGLPTVSPDRLAAPGREDKLRAGLAVFKKLLVAEGKVNNVERVLAAFEAQCTPLPPDHEQRVLVEKMIKTLRDCMAAAERV